MPSPIYVGTRVVVAVLTYLVVLQILRPLIQECPYGSCVFPNLIGWIFGDPCNPKQPSCSPTNTCYSYEYADCPQIR